MNRPRIVEIDFFRFRDALAVAAEAGNRIEPHDKSRWKAWVDEQDVREAAFKSMASNMYDGLSPVIIATEGEWHGYYLLSMTEEVCVKWSRG